MISIKEIIEDILDAELHISIAKDCSMDIYKKPLENIKLLKGVYQKSKHKKQIIEIISTSYHRNYFYLNFEFLIRIREFDKSFKVLKKILEEVKKDKIWFYEYYHILNLCMGRLNFLINDENFNHKEINELKRIFEAERFRKSSTKIRILDDGGNCENQEEVFYENLRENIVEKLDLKKLEIVKNIYNTELFKEDIDKLSKKIKELGLSEEVANSFKRLEDRYYQANDKIDFATFSSPIRTTLSGLVKDIAQKISEVEGDIIKGKEDQNYRNYLEEKRLMHQGIVKMINNLYVFLSGKINHKVSTEQEYYKRGLNIASQIGLLLVTEYGGYKNKLLEEKIKAREMLGGRTNGGFPNLSGTPEEQLKQLEGYGGQRAEEIRKRILKEIEKR